MGMPDYFSHAICAQKIYEKCDKSVKCAIDNQSLYLLGAQGGDVFFTYKLHFRKSNLGRRLHGMDPYTLFNMLASENKSYAAGFATHYALDCTLHPSIYAYENNSKSPLAHMKFESDLGLFISRKFVIQRRILPRERVLASTFAVYDSIEKIEPEVTVTGVERCLKRHFSYTRALVNGKKQTYSCDYDFHSLSGAVDDAVSFGVDCVNSVISGKLTADMFSRSFLER